MRSQVVIAAGFMVVLLLVFVGYLVMTDTGAPRHEALELSGDDLDIYVAVVDAVARPRDLDLIVFDCSRAFAHIEHVRNAIDGLPASHAEAAQDLLARGAEVKSLSGLSARGLVLADRDSLKNAGDLRRRASVQLTSIGYNSYRDLAVVYVWHFCGVTCGGSGSVLLELRRGEWGVARVVWDSVS